MRKVKRIGCLILLVGIFWLMSKPDWVYAEEIPPQKKGLDVTFVVDTSGSMRSNDPNEIAFEMIKAFIDTTYQEDIKVGFVGYSDRIVAASGLTPIAKQADRDNLKALIDSANYTGNTDIGLGLLHAYGLNAAEKKRDKVVVLISDGGTDLVGSTTGRNLTDSNRDLDQAVASWQAEGVPVYTIAFGEYGGNGEVLQQIADRTKAEMRVAESPELLTEVLYDILNQSLSSKIQQFASETYAAGSQSILCGLDEDYLSEIQVLLISPQNIGTSAIQYGKKQIPMATTPYYAVGSISGKDIDESIDELSVATQTTENQQIKVYVIGYRNLEPVLVLEREATRNKDISYQLFFKNQEGRVIQDENFYQQFEWNFTSSTPDDNQEAQIEIEAVDAGAIKGQMQFSNSGKYILKGRLADDFGSYRFQTSIEIQNTKPSGELPETDITILSKRIEWDLDEFFADTDGDALQYQLDVKKELVDAGLNEGKLTIKALKPGNEPISITISDGEDEMIYVVPLKITSIWQRYWWGFVAVALFLALLLRNIWLRFNPDFDKMMKIKSPHRFEGRLDLSFTMLPPEAEGISAQEYPLHRLLDSRIRLSELLENFPNEAKKLGLNKIGLIAEKGRRMMLYHTSNNRIRMGEAVIAKQVWQQIKVGDVVYITSEDGDYEVRLHYVSRMQQ